MNSSVRLAFVLIAASAVLVVVSTIVKKTMAGGDSVEMDLQKTAQRVSEEGPRLIGNGVRLDSAAAGPGRTIRFTHTNVEALLADVDINAFNTKYAATIRAQVCSATPPVLAKGVTMTYLYKDRTGVPIGSFDVTEEHCR